MATKAELEVELAELRREMKQRDKAPKPRGSNVDTENDKGRTPEPEGLQQLLDEHGIDAESVGVFKANLLEELTELQKEKPLVILVAALALGIIIGRTFK
ncbi:MAG: hypothetical protein ACU0CA_10080 [Paracoccaceae bacterium]